MLVTGMKLGVLAVLLGFSVVVVYGHGRLVDPPSRSSMWRYGYRTPHNFEDNQLFCGGASHQWNVNNGKCGICGDPWEGPRDNEAGGKYAKGIITRYYRKGQVFTADVEITANHLGWFEFRICPNNNVSKPATPGCLNRHLLQLADGSGTRYQIDAHKGHFFVNLKLPSDVTCSQCVFQWKYHAGNTWGTSKQEEFYGCADIAIFDVGIPFPTTVHPILLSKCHAIGKWSGRFDKDVWCKSFCAIGNCPPETCRCVKS